ncbi:hypothetical protein SAMN05444280_11483 [Tangfeifania diversioriginum]|uniref:Uncharacterized protein n=1 Tax=Tangfeifania diversioriginum TaxID=1168035 RepID=A0A1M6HTQ4_9BACT|nr:hypothetical protein SAMN05444280_11483 [Tangfeifania diversioriginum]
MLKNIKTGANLKKQSNYKKNATNDCLKIKKCKNNALKS